MSVLSRAGIGLIALIVMLSIAACSSGKPESRMSSSPSAGISPPRTASRSQRSTAQFGALTYTHPAAWHAYLIPHDDDLPNGDGAYLTNEPVSSRCTQTPRQGATLLHCPGEVTFPRPPGTGQLWIETELDYVARHQRPVGRLRIGGYHARVVSSVSVDASGFPTDRHGFPVPYCTAGTHRAVEVTATAPTTRTQPSGFVITACFGTHTHRQREAFDTMLRSAKLATRLSQSAHVPGAPRCTRDDLRLDYSQQGVSVSILGSFTFTNTAAVTCRVGGYPRLLLLIASGRPVQHITIRKVGRAVPLYLRPGTSVTATTQTFLNPDLHRRTEVTAEQLRLPGVAQPFTQHLPHGGILIYGRSPTVALSPLQGT